jgi:hypothetical protein
MTGNEYANLIASYLLHNFSERGIAVYREVDIGKSIIGKNRRIDIFVHCNELNDAFAIECKYQDSPGTTDEKIPYALDDIGALRMGGCITYAGKAFSQGVLHLLQASEQAAYCLPDPDTLARTRNTRELDHQIALHFRWWDVLIQKKKPFVVG